MFKVGILLYYADFAFAIFSIQPTLRYRPHIQDWKLHQDSPFLVELQEGGYDDTHHILKVSGLCTVRKGNIQLECKNLVYDQAKSKVFVWKAHLKDSSGDRIFFEKGVLNPTLTTGTLNDVRMLTYLRERITARKIIKSSEEKIRGEHISYTPCYACKDKLETPLWSLHSSIVEQNQQTSETEYTDTTLKLKGIPLLYIPYFYLPTRPRSGILAPYMGANVGAGFYTGLPYYYRINPHQDLKITPFYMTKGGGMLASDYRRRFFQGELRVSGAANSAPKQQTVDHQAFRGYGALDLETHFSPYWRFFMHEYSVSDRTFFTTRPFFGFTSAPYLESKSGVEGFYPKHWVSLRTLRYQNLSLDDVTQGSCAVAPELKYCYKSELFHKRLATDIEIGSVSLYRKEGTQMQRASLDTMLETHYLTPQGVQFHGSARLGQAVYSAQLRSFALRESPIYTPFEPVYVRPEHANVSYPVPINTHYYRVFPEAEGSARYPFILGWRWIITPIIQGVAAPSGINSWRIPNQDSENAQFHDGNLLAHSRFPGLDRVDDGSRINYAVQIQGKVNNTQHIEGYIGQRYSITKPALELGSVGIPKGFSDVVGRVSWNGPWAKLLYRFRAQVPQLRSQVHMVGGTVGTPVLECSGSYVFVAIDLKERAPFYRTLAHQATLQIKTNLLTRHWHVRAFITQNFKKNSVYIPEFYTHQRRFNRPLNQGVGLGYENECFLLDLFVQYSRYRMAADLRPGISFGISINFKQLGQIRTKKQLFSRNPDARQADRPPLSPVSGIEAFFPM
ncbi:LPS-assembly protein LptD [Holospora curviuscula]|uniref:LPS-assembly protein LptD n=1 Tax=Holospora curviuscula TaxID=1082868 RepID=UPI001A9C3E32|nr:LPS assembly protein LptD [Holospora curviuscula]